MNFNGRYSIKRILSFCVIVLLLLSAETGDAAKRKKEEKERYTMTETQLQSQLMSFADRFTAMMASAFARYDQESPPPEERLIILSLVQYAASSAFTVAAGSNPDTALLDMVTLVSLGRIIYEEDALKAYGTRVDPLVETFQKSEKDIWRLVGKILTQNQQQELMAIILEWREAHPEVFFFPYIRFSDFSSGQETPSKNKAKGLFSSVKNATQEVEAMRLMAERGIYLGARLPLLAGGFMDYWFSRLNQNPEFKEIVGDIHQFAAVSDRFADVAENLAQERDRTIEQVMVNMTNLMTASLEDVSRKVAKEREVTINQFMDRLSAERKDTIKDFISEERRMQGLLKDLNQTLSTGNELVTSVSTLTERLNIGKNESDDASSSNEPFTIKDYQVTLVEASGVVQQLNHLLKTFDSIMLSEGWEQALPRIVEAIDQVGSAGDERINRVFFLGLIFIMIFLVGQFFLFITYRYVALRYIEPNLKERRTNPSIS